MVARPSGNGEQTGISSPRYGPEYRKIPRSRSHSRPQFGTLLWWRFRGAARPESKLGFYHLGTDLNTYRHLVQDPIRDLNLGSPGLVSAARRGWREPWDFSKTKKWRWRSSPSLAPSLLFCHRSVSKYFPFFFSFFSSLLFFQFPLLIFFSLMNSLLLVLFLCVRVCVFFPFWFVLLGKQESRESGARSTRLGRV